MDTLVIYGQIAAHRLKERAKEFWKQERGGAEIVATIVMIAIVVLLAVLFKEQIGTLVSNLWTSINGKVGNITSDMAVGGP